MPINVYICQCGHETERIEDDYDDVFNCERCGGPAMRQFPTKTHIRLMGTGWYSVDNGRLSGGGDPKS